MDSTTLLDQLEKLSHLQDHFLGESEINVKTRAYLGATIASLLRSYRQLVRTELRTKEQE